MKIGRRPAARAVIIGILVMASAACRPGAPGVAVDRLRCESLIDPLGIDALRPRLSWVLVSGGRGVVQSAYQVLAATSEDLLSEGRADLWNSGRTASARSVQVEYAGKATASRLTCFWKVRVWDGKGRPSPWSKTASWEMGLLEPNDWRAAWIGDERVGRPVSDDPKESVPAPFFRKTFRLEQPPRRARAYVCGLGYFELYINGRKVSDDVLVPNQTDYGDRVPRKLLYPFDAVARTRDLYITYDITPFLRQGENAVGIVLGNGWYNQRGRTVEGLLWYGPPRVICQIEADGLIVGTGADWKTGRGPILFDHVFSGEVYDARLEMPGWSEPAFDDGAWTAATPAPAPGGRLEPQVSPPDRVTATLAPAKITALAGKPERWLVDFGQNFTGWVRISPRGPAGTRITIEFAEQIDEAGNKIANGDEVPTSCTYILKGGGGEVYEPRFTWFGFRYAIVSGWPGKPEPETIEGRVVHTAVPAAGEFACSNDLFNRIHRNTVWGQLGALHGGVPMDCPHRERLGYTGDGQASSETAMMNFDMERFYAKWLEDIGGAQDLGREKGYVPHTAPFGGGAGGVGWGSACVILPWKLYVHYGDERVLREHFEGMKLWVDYLGTWTRDGITLKNRAGSWNLADWFCVGDSPPKELVHTFYHSLCARIVSRAARVLGRTGDENRYAAIADESRRAFIAKFFDPSANRFHDGKNGSDVFGLALGGLPPDTAISAAGAFAGRILSDNGGHLDTGFLGTSMLFDVLSEFDRDDVAFTVMNQRTFPGYGYWIGRGATTLWETWTGLPGRHSQNHPALGGGVAWLYEGLAGLRPDPVGPGFERVIIRPAPVGDVTECRYSLETSRGTFRVEWTKKDGRLTLDVAVPPNASATVLVPAAEAGLVREGGKPAARAEGVTFLRMEGDRAVFGIGSGIYRFEAPLAPPKTDGKAAGAAEEGQE
jgi:alpha-L-rhamnosidase